MPPSPQEPVSSAVLEVAPGIALLPVALHSAFFANEVRRAVAEWKPDRIAVEAPRVADEALIEALGRLPLIHVAAWRRPGDGELALFPVDPCDARVEALRLAVETGIEAVFLDTPDAGREDSLPILPDHAAVERLGTETLARTWLDSVPPREATQRERLLAARIARAGRDNRVLAVVSIGHLGPLSKLLADPDAAAEVPEPTEPETDVRLLPVPEELLGHLLGELPSVTWLFEEFREIAAEGESFPVAEALAETLREASEAYTDETDEEIGLTEWRALQQYARNLALLRGRLLPGLHELVTAACGCVDDDFGAAVLEAATEYPATIEDETGNPDAQRRLHDPRRHRSLTLYFDFGDGVRRGVPAYPRPKLEQITFRFRRRRPLEEERDRWRAQFLESYLDWSICSWPPEDIRLERFMNLARERAMRTVSGQHSRTEEFQSSILDGLDVRETMRNWHQGKIYVRRERRPPGKVGPVVVVWRDFPLDEPDLWRMTLAAETNNESDICFYAAPLGDKMVGPLISRTEYHGIVSFMPSGSAPDLWNFSILDEWGTTCARRLLAGAIIFGMERYIAWVAPYPPDADLLELAREYHQAVVYLPIESFSRPMLKRIRQAHILGSRQARSWGRDYIEE